MGRMGLEKVATENNDYFFSAQVTKLHHNNSVTVFMFIAY